MKTTSQSTININADAQVQCRRSILIDADIQDVWSTLTNINGWSSWQSDIKKSKLKVGLAPQSSFVWHSGGVRIRSTIHTLDPYHKFGWTGKSLGIFAVHNWFLVESNDQTIVSVEESMEGMFAGLFSNSLNKSLEKGLQGWLDLLKTACESNI